MEVDLQNVEIVEETMEDSNEEISIPTPNIGDVDWPNYVLSQLSEEEKKDGYPTVNGLRRIVEVVLGTVIDSQPINVYGPSSPDKLVATINYRIVIQLFTGEVVTFGGAADAGSHNLQYPFSAYPTAIAETRAEGRALRKALRLNVIAAEELADNSELSAGNKPIVDRDNGDEYINNQQVNFINMMCKRLNINVKSFVNLTLNKEYSMIGGVYYSDAQTLIRKLQEWQGDSKLITEEYQGYSGNFE